MKKKPKIRNKYYLLYILSISIIIISIFLSVFIYIEFIKVSQKTTDEVIYEQYYVMIPEDRNLGFWQSVYEGAYQQGLANNIFVEMLGENLNENYSNEELMKIAIASNVDGIIVSANEGEQMTELINEATLDGIPVVTVYNDNTKSDRCSFVGVGRYNIGREYGRQILKIANEKRGISVQTLDSGSTNMDVVVLVNAYSQDSGQNILCSGITETIEKEKDSKTNINLTLVSVDNTNTFSVEESIRDIFMEKELPDIIICLNELNTTCVYQAVVDYNKVGVVDILGYYSSDTIYNAISRDVIFATVSVDTLQMGQYCVDALMEYNSAGNTSQYFTSDITLIDKLNIKEYMQGGADEE